uniref:Ripply transcriptional repressor 1 n=1 Tax=Gopherus evgoodei TaxID=1825980 RepID=A0A8C4WIN8_9SAUR
PAAVRCWWMAPQACLAAPLLLLYHWAPPHMAVPMPLTPDLQPPASPVLGPMQDGLPLSHPWAFQRGSEGTCISQVCFPHRLFWPRSKSFDYLYSEGEKLLENFPVQATISLYEDSDSEEEEEEEEEGWGEEGQVEEGGQQAEESVLQQEAGCRQGPAGASQPIKLCLK